MKTCERCGAKPEGEYGLLDYCAVCSQDLCDACMEKGCCGHVPAISGTDADNSSEQPMKAKDDPYEVRLTDGTLANGPLRETE